MFKYYASISTLASIDDFYLFFLLLHTYSHFYFYYYFNRIPIGKIVFIIIDIITARIIVYASKTLLFYVLNMLANVR